jgi:hypothetical protein
MTDKKEYKGIWFLPDKPEQTVSGILHFIPTEVLRLELIGTLLCEGNVFCSPKSEIQTIHGIVKTENGVSKITLFDCHKGYNSGYSHNNIQNIRICLSNYNCGYALLGKHLSTKEDLTFNKIKIFLPHLNDWYQDNAIQFDADNNYTAIFTVCNKNDNSLEYQITEKIRLSIKGYSDFYDVGKHKKCLSENTYVELENTEKQCFYTLLEQIVWFKNFYSFAAMTTMPFDNIFLYDYEDYYEIENGISKIKSIKERIYKPITLFFITQETFKKSDSFSHYNFLFSHKDIANDLLTILKNWYGKKDCKPIIEHLISSITFKRNFTSVDFLIVIQAIEGYYNRFLKEAPLTTILQNLYDEYKDISLLVSNRVDINQAVDSRHYYSHILPEKKKKNVCYDWELLILTEKLKLLLICCILSLIGCNNNKINELLSNLPRTSFYPDSILNKPTEI